MIKDLSNIDEFMEWLKCSEDTQCTLEIMNTKTMFVRVKKNPDIVYLYAQSMYGGVLDRSHKLEYAGTYCKKSKTLYDVYYPLLHEMESDGYQPPKGFGRIKDEMCEKIRNRVEQILQNDRENLDVSEITDANLLKTLEHFQGRTAQESARKAYFDGEEVGVFRCKFTMPDIVDDVSEALLEYIVAPEQYVESMAELYISQNQEKILLDFKIEDAIKAAYEEIVNDSFHPAHFSKKIAEAVSCSKAKTINVTIRRNEKEGTFKFQADQFRRDCNDYGYATWSLTKAEDKRFKSLFDTHESHFYPQEIVKITYGKKTIYEVPSSETK